MELVRIEGLPESPLEAAAAFHALTLPTLARDADLLLVFPPADHAHRMWRLAAVQELARAAAPRRVNAIATDDEAAISSAMIYLANAPGVTGQYWLLDAVGVQRA